MQKSEFNSFSLKGTKNFSGWKKSWDIAKEPLLVLAGVNVGVFLLSRVILLNPIVFLFISIIVSIWAIRQGIQRSFERISAESFSLVKISFIIAALPIVAAFFIGIWKISINIETLRLNIGNLTFLAGLVNQIGGYTQLGFYSALIYGFAAFFILAGRQKEHSFLGYLGQRTRLFFGIVGIQLLAAAILAGILIAVPELIQREQQPRQPLSTAEWNTYSNDKYNYTFQYPEIVGLLHEYPDGGRKECRKLPRRNEVVVASMGDKLTVVMVCERLSQEQIDFYPGEYTTDVIIDGVIAYRHDFISATGYRNRIIQIATELDAFIEISFSYGNVDRLSNVHELDDREWEQILSTFRFIEEISEGEKILCEAAGGIYVGCPANPSPNMGLCIPCECPQGFMWSLSGQACVGVCPGEYCDLDKQR